ncbi:PD-(D/E)XK nuclease family protein [Paracidovorax anthurii]|uniref:PD-(D/E)XK endonuclease-like domain-containing protein n=1 Tax=Paracidovorax anthurii TaxID=78229 RepID=A0A328Z8M5_9BURK|nr:PD-(D/E)XK nuclease family protein [Paracidovorax anthurii]RAR81032.1 hypothetical protein AX018_102148 [Paracidovorax anthurii]
MTAAVAVGLGCLVLALLLARAWWFRRTLSAEQRSRPKALAQAELVYMETLFRIQQPFPLVAKVDRVYRLPRGPLVLVELKVRQQNRPHLSDVVQLSAQRLVIAMETGETVAPYGFVSIPIPGRHGVFRSHRVDLLNSSELVRLYRRREEVLALRVHPGYAASEAACRSCALRSKCDRFNDRT